MSLNAKKVALLGASNALCAAMLLSAGGAAARTAPPQQPVFAHAAHARALAARISLSGAAREGSATTFKVHIALPRHDRVAKYSISFGDGQVARGRHVPTTVRHTYVTPGRRRVVLSITDTRHHGTSTSMTTQVVSVLSPPTPGVSPLPVSTSPGTPENKAPESAPKQPSAAEQLHQQLSEWTMGHPSVGHPESSTESEAGGDSLLANVSGLYPGALIQGNATNIENGILTPVPVRPAAGTITLSGVQLRRGGTVTAHVAEASEGPITQAIQNLRGQDEFESHGLDAASLKFQNVTSAQEAAFDAKASFSYAGIGKASGDFSEANNEHENHLMFEMEQTYYSINYQPDFVAGGGYDDLDAFFAAGTTALQATACGCMSAAEPPMFVASVTYGTRFIFIASSKADTAEMKASLSAAVSYGAASGSVTLTKSQKSTLDETKLQVVAVGGNTGSLGQAFAGALGSGGTGVTNWLGKFVTESLNNGMQSSVPLSYQLEYLDGQNVGEFVPKPPNNNPIPDTDMVGSMQIAVTMGTDDRSCQDPVTVSLTNNQNQQLVAGMTIAGAGSFWNPCATSSPYCPNPSGPADYWNNQGAGQGTIVCTVPFSHPVHAYTIAGSQLEIRGAGDSWHAGFQVSFPLPGLGASGPGQYVSYTTTPNMFFNVDGGNGNPCDDESRNFGYSLTLFEPNEPEARTPKCPSAIAG
jgi:hypothetical protein